VVLSPFRCEPRYDPYTQNLKIETDISRARGGKWDLSAGTDGKKATLNLHVSELAGKRELLPSCSGGSHVQSIAVNETKP